MSKGLRPGNSFYQYVNQTWLNKSHLLPSWRSEFSITSEVEEIINTRLLALIKTQDCDSKNIYKKSLCHVYHLLKKPTKCDLQVLRTYLNTLISNPPLESLAWLCQSRIPTVITLTSEEEKVRPYHVRPYLGSGDLTLPLKFYTTKGRVWKAYTHYVSTCALEFGYPFLVDAIEAETSLAAIIDTDKEPSRVHAKSLRKLRPFMESLHIREHCIIDPSLGKILAWVSSPTTGQSARATFILHCINFALPYLGLPRTNPVIVAAEALFQGALMGAKAPIPQEEQHLMTLKNLLPDALCHIYSADQAQQIPPGLLTLIENLQNATIELMCESPLSSKTRTAIVEKVHRMRFEIGRIHNEKTQLNGLVLDPKSLLRTAIAVQQCRSKYIHTLLGKPTDQNDISYPCYDVNASYYTETNHIVLPWGIFQEPFFFPGSSIGWNYGGLGTTIAHEITHAFDIEGSKYSPRAVYKESWTRKNRTSYNKMTRKVQVFYRRFKHYGRKLDGEKTLSENWADLGGLAIALRALKGHLQTAKGSKEADEYRDFFLSYAVSWRTLMRKEHAIHAMMQGVHSLPEDRVDRIVPHFQEWVDTFDIKPTDPLYIEPEKRLRFF